MSAEVDYYDVQNMIRDARSSIRAEIDQAVREARQEFRDEIIELHAKINSLGRTLNARTEHLA